MTEPWMSRGARGLHGDRAHDPGHPKGDACGEAGAQQAVDRLQARDDEQRPGPHGHPLKAGGEDPADQQRAHEAEHGRVGRVGAGGQDERGQPGAEERPEREAGQRQRADEEALREAVQGQQDREDDDEPVDAAHGSALYGLAGPTTSHPPDRRERVAVRPRRSGAASRQIGYDLPGVGHRGQWMASRARARAAVWRCNLNDGR
jgi:hypothetical protein